MSFYTAALPLPRGGGLVSLEMGLRSCVNCTTAWPLVVALASHQADLSGLPDSMQYHQPREFATYRSGYIQRPACSAWYCTSERPADVKEPGLAPS